MLTKKTQSRYALADFADMANRLARKIDDSTSLLKKQTSSLKQLAEELDLGYIEILQPDVTNIKDSLKKWEKYLQTNNSTEIINSDIYNISFIYEIINNDIFWDFINNKKFITEKVVRVLLRQIHYFWTDLNNFEYKIEIFQKILEQLQTKKKLFSEWKKDSSTIVDLNLVQYFKNELINKNIKLNDLYIKKKYDLKKEDLLSNLIEIEYLIHSIQMLSSDSSNINEMYEIFKKFMNSSVKPKTYEDRNSYKTLLKYRNLILSTMILCCNNLQLLVMKKDLIDFVINKTTYGDPRIVEWTNFDTENEILAKKIFKTWLNERDIKFFFENLIDDDPHYRKDFWLGYANEIEDAIFILGNDVKANRDNFDEISRFKKLLPQKFLKVGQRHKFDTNVFILKIGNIYMLEFSKSGNACYAYSSQNYDKYISFLLKESRLKSLQTSDLKKELVAMHKFNHFTNWQYKLSSFIENNKKN